MEAEEHDVALAEFFASLREEFEEADPDRTNRAAVPEGQRSCPICDALMTSAHEKGVLIDICQEHGMWLDKDELRAIVKRCQESELVSELKAREAAEKEAAKGLSIHGNFLVGYSLGRLMG